MGQFNASGDSATKSDGIRLFDATDGDARLDLKLSKISHCVSLVILFLTKLRLRLIMLS